MPTQDSFDPMLYLAIMHGETSLSDLKTGQQNLSFEVSERTGQLKDLVSTQAGFKHSYFSHACMPAISQHVMSFTLAVKEKWLSKQRDACVHYVLSWRSFTSENNSVWRHDPSMKGRLDKPLTWRLSVEGQREL